MPVFQVRRRIDAYVNYVADVEADTPAEAAQTAEDDERSFKWELEGTDEFDDRQFVTLDEDGEEIEATQVG